MFVSAGWAGIEADCRGILYSRYKHRRVKLMEKLGKLKAKKGAWVFVHKRILQDKDPDIRVAAIRNLMRMKLTGVDFYIKKIIDHLKVEKNYRVRKMALDYLSNQTTQKWLAKSTRIIIDHLADRHPGVVKAAINQLRFNRGIIYHLLDQRLKTEKNSKILAGIYEVFSYTKNSKRLRVFYLGMGHPDPRVQQRVVQIASGWPYKKSKPYLDEFISGDDPLKKANALRVKTSKPAQRQKLGSTYFQQLLQDDDEYLRAVAMEILFFKYHKREKKIIGKYLTLIKSENPQIREVSYKINNLVPSPRRSFWIKKGLTDPFEPIQRISLKGVLNSALEEALPSTVPLLESDTPDVRLLAIRVLGHVAGREYAQYLMFCLKDPNVRVRIEAAGALYQMGAKDSLWIMKGMLQDPIPKVREFAAKSLGEAQVKDAFPLLLKLIDDENNHVAFTAVKAAAQIRSPEAYRLVLPLLQLTPKPANIFRIRAGIYIARESGDKRFLPRLIRLSKVPKRREKYPALQIDAIRAIGKYDTAQSKQYLFSLLKKSSGHFKAEAALALGYLKYRPAIPYFKRIFNRQKDWFDKHYKLHAAFALLNMGIRQRQYISHLCLSLRTRNHKKTNKVLSFMSRLNLKGASRFILRELQSGRPINKRKAVETLAQIGEPKSYWYYLKTIKLSHDPEILDICVDALKKVKGKTVVHETKDPDNPRKKIKKTVVISRRVKKALDYYRRISNHWVNLVRIRRLIRYYEE